MAIDLDFEIDLGDGLPPALVKKQDKAAKVSERLPVRFAAPATIQVTSTPISVVIMYARVRCLSCGGEHRDYHGLFLESRLNPGRCTQLKSVQLSELEPYLHLPRRVEILEDKATPLCIDCFALDKAFRNAVLVARTQPDLFAVDPTQGEDLAKVSEKLVRLHTNQLLEDELDLEEL